MRLRLLVITILIFSLTASTSFAQSIDLDSLLVKSIGGPAALEEIRSLESMRLTGSIDFNGMPGRFEILFRLPDKYYQVLDLGQFVQMAAFDGTTAWQRDHNGRISELTGIEKKSLMSDIYLQSYAYLLNDEVDDVMRYNGQVDYNGSDYHDITFEAEGMDSLRLLLDTESAVLRYVFRQMSGIDVVLEFSDYEMISGILIGKKATTTALQAPIAIEMITDSVEVNLPLNDSLFTFPTSSRIDYLFSHDSTSFVLPIVFDGDYIWVEATLNGKLKAWFILDSGASANVLHEPLVDALHLPAAGAIPTQGIAGFETVKLVQYDSLVIGDVTLLSQVAATMNIAGFESSAPDNGRFGGILGQDFLSRFPMLIDYKEQQITIYNPDHFDPPSGGRTIAFRLTSNIPTVTASIDNVRGDFIVDLGNPYDLIIHRAFSKEHQIEDVVEDLKTNSGTLGGIGGSVEVHRGTTAAFEIDGFRVERCSVLLPGESGGISASDEIAGNIGNGILKNYGVLFDYSNSRLILYKHE